MIFISINVVIIVVMMFDIKLRSKIIRVMKSFIFILFKIEFIVVLSLLIVRLNINFIMRIIVVIR